MSSLTNPPDVQVDVPSISSINTTATEPTSDAFSRCDQCDRPLAEASIYSVNLLWGGITLRCECGTRHHKSLILSEPKQSG